MSEESIELNETEETFLAFLELKPNIAGAAEASGISRSHGYKLSKKLKDIIIERARDTLSLAALKAANTTINMMDADGATENAAIKLKAAEMIMDRVGLTRHTSVEVSIESENGIFILPGKTEVPPEPEEAVTDVASAAGNPSTKGTSL